ncbi:MAG: T9SS type A sorting domain-containing protein [Lentimicrobiaceae bacterium]|nr:T9SS type A sorting domain-containing protein [Lentimicrobiaceae bacterium]
MKKSFILFLFVVSTIWLSAQNNMLNFNQKINISHINSGIYFVKITTEEGTTTKKIIKH